MNLLANSLVVKSQVLQSDSRLTSTQILVGFEIIGIGTSLLTIYMALQSSDGGN